MSYINPDFGTKKEFKAALASGKTFRTYNPLGMFETTQNGSDSVEGPHYPKTHKWYAEVTVQDGIVMSVK